MQKSLMGLGIAATLVIAATALTTARSRSSLRADRVSSTEQSLVREAAPFNRLVHNRADELKLELSRLAGERAPAFESESFDGMAWIEPGSSADDFSTKWTSQGSHIDASWLQSLPLRNLHDGDAIFIHHTQKTADGETSIEGLLITAESFAPGATVVEGQGHRIVLFGVLNPNAFAGLVDDWVGSSRTAQIFDEKGVVLAHTNRRSVGSELKDEGIVQAMASGKRASVSGVFDDSEGRPLVAQAERIPQTNLRISLSVPQRLLDQTIAGTVQSVFWLTLAGLSLLAGLAYWVYTRLLAQSSTSIFDDADDDAHATMKPRRPPVGARGWLNVAKTAFTSAAGSVEAAEAMPTSLRALEIPATVRVEARSESNKARGLAARISEAKGEASANDLGAAYNADSGYQPYQSSYDPASYDPVVPQEATPLTFEDIEIKAKANVKEILDRSAAIRARLNLDFVDEFTHVPAAPAAESKDGDAADEQLLSVSFSPDEDEPETTVSASMGDIAIEIADALAHERSITGPGSIANVDWEASNSKMLTNFSEVKKDGFVRKPKLKEQTEPKL